MSKFGVDRLEIYDSPDDVLKNVTSRIITLENCIKITQKPPNVFTLFKKTSQYEFATLCEEDLPIWVTALQSVAFKDEASRITHIEEDNDLYCSSGEGVFSVKVSPSKASVKCGLEEKNYTLVLTSTAIQLRNTEDNRLLFTWPFCFIRRYGYRSANFTFEAGRKCETGEGLFHLNHANPEEIYRCLSSKMKSMKKILTGEPQSTLLDCGDNQFHAALSMEARSRSPLPPSPLDTDNDDKSFSNLNNRYVNNSSSQSSSKSLLSFTDFSDISTDKSLSLRSPMPKPKPLKPPRKNLIPARGKTEDSTHYEPVSVDSKINYDKVEVRKEAWKTLGVNNINHTESKSSSMGDLTLDNDELEEYTSWSQVKLVRAQQPLKLFNNSTKILRISSTEELDESYDKLNHFGSSSKLSTINPGYKQVTASPVHSNPAPPSWNDYDEVEINMQAVRLADDSHLGYGVIRKAQMLQQQKQEEKVPHRMYNEDTYAIVSKPKRV